MDIADFLDNDAETPMYNMHEYKEGGSQPQPLDAKDITPEAYVLPSGGQHKNGYR